MSKRGQGLIVLTVCSAVFGAAYLAWFRHLGWLESSVFGAMQGAFVAFLGATIFKYLFESARDADLVDAEKTFLAAALFAEIRAILVRANEHYRWLVTCLIEGKPSEDEADKKEKLPEVYAIFDTDIFDDVRARIGIFDPHLTALLVTTYHSLATSRRRADRYVEQTRTAVYASLPAAIAEIGTALESGTKAAAMLKAIAGVKADIPEYRPVHFISLGRMSVMRPDRPDATMSMITPADVLSVDVDPRATRAL